VKLNEFAKATGVVVVNGFRIPKRLHYWAGEEEKEQVLKHFVCVKCVVCVVCVLPALYYGLLHPGGPL